MTTLIDVSFVDAITLGTLTNHLKHWPSSPREGERVRLRGTDLVPRTFVVTRVIWEGDGLGCDVLVREEGKTE